MHKIIKAILNNIEKEGFKAYLVGGFVRDYLLGIKSLDIDICTNALPKDLLNIFQNVKISFNSNPNNNLNNNPYGGINFQIKGFNIDITTFRKELAYEKRKPTSILYVDNIEEDIKRRDFTINSICLDKNEKILDLTGGIQDLNNRLIRMIGNIDDKLKEDPLRILRAIRFATTLDFNLEDTLYHKIQDNYELVKTLSKERIKSELTKILLHKNFKKGLKLLKDLKILDILKINYNEDITYINDICGMWAQLNIEDDYLFTKQENRNIINIRQIIKSGIVNNKTLYNYGLYNSLVAGEILNINKKSITKMYNKLSIKSRNDLKITVEEIIDILNIKPSKEIKNIQQELIDLILDGKLNNKKEELIYYLKHR